MGKLINFRKNKGKESPDSELAAFEEEIVSLDETEEEEAQEFYTEEIILPPDDLSDAGTGYTGVIDLSSSSLGNETAETDPDTSYVGTETAEIGFDTAAMDLPEDGEYYTEEINITDEDLPEDGEYYTEEINVTDEDLPEDGEYYTEEINITDEDLPEEGEYYTEEINISDEDLPEDKEYYTEEIDVPEEYKEVGTDTSSIGFETAEIGFDTVAMEPPADGEYYTEEINITDEDFPADDESYDEGYEDAREETFDDKYEETFDENYDEGYDDRDEVTDDTIPTASEFVDLDDAVIDDRRPSGRRSSALKIVLIAVACIALALVGVFALKDKIHIGGGNASSIRVTDLGIPVADELLGVGSEISDIQVIGQSGLIAALDARQAAAAAQTSVSEPDPGPSVHTDYNETEIVNEVKISIELITVKSDLKIRFLNATTGKLLPNIPFQVTVTDPSGKNITWNDDDMDGIIYKASLGDGNYKVHVEPISGDKYNGYVWPADKSASIKSTIEYAQVDVQGEVKDVTQVNESAEDTVSRGDTAEIDLSNTVAFLESTATPVYTEVSKDTIANPVGDTGLNTWNGPASGSGYLGGIVLTSEQSGDKPADNSGDKPAENNGDKPSDNNGDKPAENSSDKPAENSGDKPAENSGDKPADNSGDKPAENSGDKPEDKPAEKPSVSVTLSETSLTLNAGDKKDITISYSLTVATGCSLEVYSTDTGIATVSVSDKTVTITAVGAGSAEIRVKAVTEKNDKTSETAEASAKCSITVNNVDMSQQLKDRSGNEIYVFENDEYRRATFADYAKFDKFYIITGTKYTGWQTIDGSTYYYDGDGKPVTGTQVIQGVTYLFGGDGRMTSASGIFGIDVSKWNGKIDWNAVKASGAEYVIIRVGYRGSSLGSLIDDPMFATNITGAKAAGLKVGVYFVTQAVNDVEAVYEASMVLDRIKGYALDYPVFLDVEPSGGRGDKIDKATRTAVCVAFCETIRSAGYTAGIYANKTWLSSKMDASQFGNYKIWVAHYASVCGYTGRYDMWQYSDKGTVSGISGKVDMNLRYT